MDKVLKVVATVAYVGMCATIAYGFKKAADSEAVAKMTEVSSRMQEVYMRGRLDMLQEITIQKSEQ